MKIKVTGRSDDKHSYFYAVYYIEKKKGGYVGYLGSWNGKLAIESDIGRLSPRIAEALTRRIVEEEFHCKLKEVEVTVLEP